MNRVGVIGLGDFGSFALRAFEFLENFELAAVSEIRNDAIVPRGVKFYKNYEDLLADPKVDVVHIVTENFSHTPIAVEALKLNKKVLAEKPLFINLNQMGQVRRAAKIKNSLKINFVLPNSQLYQKVFETIGSNRLGNLLYIRIDNYATESRTEKAWYHDDKKTGGWFATSDIHFLHLIMLATGEMPKIIDVVKFSKNALISTLCYMNCGQVPVALYHHMDAGNFKNCLAKFIFEDGEITVCGWVPMKLKERSKQGSNVIIESESADSVYLRLIARNYEKLLENDQSDELDKAFLINELALEINKV